jgi:parallel beta-helix repeat protein
LLYNCTNITIEQCKAINNRNAITGLASDNNTLTGNILAGNQYHGLLLGDLVSTGSDHNLVVGNTIYNNLDGVYLEFSDGNIIASNLVVDNRENGIVLSNSHWNNVSGNNASGNGKMAQGNGIFIEDSDDNVVSGNDACNNNVIGIHLYFARRTVVTSNNASHNTNHGIYMDNSEHATIMNNQVVYQAGTCIPVFPWWGWIVLIPIAFIFLVVIGSLKIKNRMRFNIRLPRAFNIGKSVTRLKARIAHHAEMQRERHEQRAIEALKRLIKVYTRIKTSKMRSLLGMDRFSFQKKILSWAEQYGFKLDGDWVIFSEGKLDTFIDDVDALFNEWSNQEKMKKNKI